MPASPAIAGHSDCRVAASGRLALHALAYRRPRPGPHRGTDLDGGARHLADIAVDEATRSTDAMASVDEHVITSTVISPLLMDGGALSRAFVARVSAGLGRALDWMTCSYECAGWGFVLRDQCRWADEQGRSRRLLLQVLDIDIHRFGVWLHNPKWGASGFGIATLLLEIAPAATRAAACHRLAGPPVHDSSLPVEVGAAAPAFALPQLARTLRDFCRTRPGIPVALPFFPDAQRQALVRALDVEVAPDGHPRFGHCFGSDPWISLLLRLAGPVGPATERFVASSLALNGYHATADVRLAPGARCRLEDDT